MAVPVCVRGVHLAQLVRSCLRSAALVLPFLTLMVLMCLDSR